MFEIKFDRFNKLAILWTIVFFGGALVALLLPSESNLEEKPRILDMDFASTDDISQETIAKENAMIQNWQNMQLTNLFTLDTKQQNKLGNVDTMIPRRLRNT